MIAMHELHIPPNFITSRVMPQVEKYAKTAYQYFSAHANGAMQCMTSLLPTNPKEGSEGCNHIAISQSALLYRYLPHQSGYGFFICIFNMRVQKHDCNA